MGYIYYICISLKKPSNMKTIDFENAKMILSGFLATGCHVSSNDKFNKYGTMIFNLKEAKTVRIEITHQEMGLVSFFSVLKNTYIKLKKDGLL